MAQVVCAPTREGHWMSHAEDKDAKRLRVRRSRPIDSEAFHEQSIDISVEVEPKKKDELVEQSLNLARKMAPRHKDKGGVNNMHGHSEEDFHRELEKAKAGGDIVRMNVLNAAYKIVDHVDYEHLHTLVDLKLLLDTAKRQVRLADLLSKRDPDIPFS